MDFEWDPDKEQSNQRKHGISFFEASTVFGDPMELTIYNPDHSEGEYRFLSMGRADVCLWFLTPNVRKTGLELSTQGRLLRQR